MTQHQLGALTCVRYAFAPDYYYHCGPDANRELGAYLQTVVVDIGLVGQLVSFEVMCPYLVAIAQANGLRDLVDSRVVEAYWASNDLLEHVRGRDVYMTSTERLGLQRRIATQELKWLLPKVVMDPSEHVIPSSDPWIILDVAIGMDENMVIDDLSHLEQVKGQSVHDYDVYMELKLREKLGQLPQVRIILLPMEGEIKGILDKVVEL